MRNRKPVAAHAAPAQQLLPGYAVLPALTDEQREEIARETDEALRDLLTSDAMSDNTLRSYQSALRYWDAWHRSTYGTPLPLLVEPRRSVSTEAVQAFIAHHAPAATAGPGSQIAMAMPQHVVDRMRELDAFGKRRVSGRTGVIAAKDKEAGRKQLSPDLPSLATIRHRYAALRACHSYARIPAEFANDATIREALRNLPSRVDRLAPAMKKMPKEMLGREAVEAILRDCAADGLAGIRDAALLHVAFDAGGRRRSELASMQWEQLQPTRFPIGNDEWVEGYVWSIARTKGRESDRADRGALEVPLVNDVADAIDRWRDALAAHGLPLTGPVWRKVRQRKAKTPEGEGLYQVKGELTGKDIWALVKGWAERLGLDPAQFGAHSLRSGAATTLLDEGADLEAVSRLLDHRSLETTRMYDHRKMPVATLVQHLANRKR